MLNKMITFIGPGAMAEAMIAGLIRQGLAEPEHLLVSGAAPDKHILHLAATNSRVFVSGWVEDTTPCS